MGDYLGNALVTVICADDLGQVASLLIASVHPAVQMGAWRKLEEANGADYMLAGLRTIWSGWDTLMPTPGGVPVGLFPAPLWPGPG